MAAAEPRQRKAGGSEASGENAPLISGTDTASQPKSLAEDDFWKYRRVRDDLDLQRRQIPWKSVILALSLLTGGLVLLYFGLLGFFGYRDFEPDKVHGMLTLGIILILPGSYSTTIAFRAWRGDKGFTYDLLPEM